jgi:uncharacterized protein (DUF302 family)
MDHVVVVESAKPFEEACRALEQAVAEHHFGVLHVHDLGKTLAGKGFPLGFEARVFDVCNPQRAHEVLRASPVLSVALPCAISVFTEGGRTKLAFIRPTAMLGLFGAGAQDVALEVEAAVLKIVERAAA